MSVLVTTQHLACTSGNSPPGLHCRQNIGIACLEVTDGRVVLINADRALSCHRWISLRTDAGAFTFTSATPEISYTVEAESAPPRSVTVELLAL